MGLVMDARCAGCDYEQADVRLGATHVQIAQHDVCTLEVYEAPCCKRLQSVLILMGQPLPHIPCDACGAELPLRAEQRYRIATLKGEIFSGHRCPACSGSTLSSPARPVRLTDDAP